MGPGKYDEYCTRMLKETEAEGTVLIVVNGKLGSGFSATGSALFLASISDMLRQAADEVERSFMQS
jgi:hypothetical protein